MGLPTSVQHCTGVAILRCNKARKIKSTQTGKEEVKLSLFAYHMTVYTESPKESTKSSLVRVSEFSQVARHKINVPKSNTSTYKE